MSPKSRPRVIADSDDEDDGNYSPPLSPQAQSAVESQAAAGSSGRPSHATSSTDLNFFQSVYNEQNDAALRQTHMVQYGSPRESGIQLGGDKAEMTGKPINDDAIWEIPSSAEADHQSKPSRMTKISRIGDLQQNSGHEIREASYVNAQEVDHQNDLSHDQSARSKKRRKVGSIDHNRSDPDGIELIPIHSSNETVSRNQSTRDHRATEIYDPATLDGEPFFFIAQKPLTESQKLSYQSMGPPSSAITEPNQLYPDYPTYQLKLASSGSVTNMNTPRSASGIDSLPLPSTAPWSQDAVVAAKQEIQRSLHNRRGSSPDIISMAGPDLSNKEAHGHPTEIEQNQEIPPKREVAAIDIIKSPGDHDHGEDVGASEQPPDAIAEPTQGKRKRGRPRKGAAPEVDSAAATINRTGEETPVKEKKKRGRPKKQSQQLDGKGNSSPGLEAPTKVEDGGEAKAKEGDGVERNHKKPATEPKASPPSITTPKHMEKADENQVIRPASIKEASPNFSSPDTAKKSLTEETAGIQQGKQESKLERKDRKATATALTPGSKPLFRVGLSKRSKIAPLLKCLPK